MVSGRQTILVYIDLGHLYDADGISQDRLCLSVLVTCGINLQLRRFGPLGVIVLEKADKHFDGLFALKLDGCTDNACGVPIQHKGLKPGEFRSNGVDRRVWAVLEEDSAFFKRCEVSAEG